MVRSEKPPKKYSTTINPEVNDPYDAYLTKKHEILQKIEEKKHLIHLTKSMSDAPDSEGGISREKAHRTIELFNKDISKLEKELRKLESGENITTTSTDDRLKEPKPLEVETEQSVQMPKSEPVVVELESVNSPPKVEEKYKSEYVGTNVHDDPIIQDTPIKSYNWYAIIILLIIFSSSLYFVMSNSNSQNTNHVTPSNFSTNNAEKVTNPMPAPKNIFDKINEYREQNKKHKILWSDDAYHLADFRASDMVKHNYLSHTTPDGKTISDYIGKYNFYNDSAWGENLCKDCSDPTQTWIGSAGDREILLGGWGKGAVACESDICVFIGVNE